MDIFQFLSGFNTLKIFHTVPLISILSFNSFLDLTQEIAEMLEDRKYQFIEELESLGLQKEKAEKEVADTINLIVYYAGWTDKFQQIYSNVNPVKNSFFNFSIAEALGVISVLPPQKSALLGFVASFLPAFVGRNTCIILASEQYPTPAISFAEVLNSSDVPEGTINILTGFNDELIKHLTTHMNINGVIYYGNNKDKIKTIQENAATNIKRTIIRNFDENKLENPYIIFDTLETKTIWQPRII